ncbi:MAG TPA: hypothetical protein VJP86_07370 [Vicinamibacterales bacterium]|nr:hypothetical protein [Vicinamibacterales bacterium]
MHTQISNAPEEGSAGTSIDARLRASAASTWQIVRTRVVTAALVAWLPLFVLSALGGLVAGGVQVPLLHDFPVTVRFLIALPLFVFGAAFTGARIDDLHNQLLCSGIVRETEAGAFQSMVGRLRRMRNSWMVRGAIVLLVVFGTAFLRMEFSGEASSWQFVGSARSLPGWWYLLVSVPLFQFWLAMCVWRYLVWCWFLFRLSRMDLSLMATHPDRSAGLTVIGQVHQTFGIMAFALSSILSAQVGLEIVNAGRSIFDYRMMVGAFALLVLTVFLVPLLVFVPKLVRTRRRGLLEYGALAGEYTRAFHDKWIRNDPAPAEPLIGSADIQSLADIGGSFDVVHQMRVVPFEIRIVAAILLSALAPLFPLIFAVLAPLDVVKGLIQILL